MIGRVSQQLQRRQPKDIGLIRTELGRPIERTLSTEDLRQEALRLIQARQAKLPATPAELERYLYPKLRKAATWQVRGMTQPVRVPEAEQRILSLEQRIRAARERDPRFAQLSVSPGEIFVKLAKDPGFAATLRRQGGKGYFGTRSGVERTLEAGLPKAARDPKTAGALEAGTPSPLDELLAKQADEFTGPMARVELALRALTDKQREVVTRVMGLGRPAEGIREVARDLKVSHVTVIGHYRAGMKRLGAAAKQRAPKTPEPPYIPKGIEPTKKTAAELVNERLAEMKRRVEARRRWEEFAPIRRMREKEPVRTYTPRKWGEAIIPTGKGKGPQ